MTTAAPSKNIRSLSGLTPYLRRYRLRIALAVLFLVLAAVSTLIFPLALKSLIDEGFVSTDPGARVMALRGHFFALFAVGAALGLFSALRFYMVTWLGERVTADLRNDVYAHVVRQSPEFFETTQTGEVLSRLTTDTTLVQTVVADESGRWLKMSFCAVCGTTVAHTAQVRPGMRSIAAGTFDETDWFTIDRHIWVQSKQAWVTIPAGITTYPKGVTPSSPTPDKA